MRSTETRCVKCDLVVWSGGSLLCAVHSFYAGSRGYVAIGSEVSEWLTAKWNRGEAC